MANPLKKYARKITRPIRRTGWYKRHPIGRPWLFHTFSRTFFPIDERQILILSDSRSDLTGNLEFIVDEIRRRYPEYRITTFLRPSLKSRRQKGYKYRLPHAIATSKYIILDDYYPYIYRLNLRKGVRLIQAWHAAGAFKRVGFSRTDLPDNGANLRSHRGYTDAIVSSEMIRKNYAEAFRMPIEGVHPYGVPRTDVFFDETYTSATRERIRTALGIGEAEQLVLYAPTFRGSGQRSAHFDFETIDWDRLAEQTPDNVRIVVKIHPFVRKRTDEYLTHPKYLDASDQREINDLLMASDVLITDYSSVIFEWALLKRPVIFHVPDLEEYQEGRSFFYPFERYIFGPTTRTTDELIRALEAPKVDTEQLDRFVTDFMSACDGHSTERFVSKLIAPPPTER